jgi:hypothetical protein
MKKIKNIKAKEYREDYKKICRLWLIPKLLTANQIKDTIDDFSCAVGFTLDIETDEEYTASNIAILVSDILEMNSISEEEKDVAILKLVQDCPEDQKVLSDLARRVIKQINIDVKNYKNTARSRGYCLELLRRL